MTTEQVTEPTEKTTDALVGRLVEATIGSMDLLTVYVGDRLGLYRALHDGGPATAADLAARAGIDPRYALEWLEQQAATGILDVDDVDGVGRRAAVQPPRGLRRSPARPRQPVVHRAAHPVGGRRSAKVMPQLLDAYRTGGGVAWSDYGADMIESQGDFNRPWLVGSFGTELLPAIPGIHERLQRTRRRVSRTSPAASAGRRSRSRAPTRRCASTASISTNRRSSSHARTPATRA